MEKTKIIGLLMVIFAFMGMGLQYIGGEKVCIIDESTNNRSCYYHDENITLSSDSIIELNPNDFNPRTVSAIDWIRLIETGFALVMLIIIVLLGWMYLREYF